MKNPLLFCIFLLGIASCNNLKTSDKINADIVNSTIKKKKIKRVLDDDIVSFGYEKGESVAMSVKPKLPAMADSLCQLNTEELLKELGIEGVSDMTLRCEPRFFTHPKEKEMWEAYQKAFEEGIEAPAGVQRLGVKQSYQQLLYAMPIFYEAEGGRKFAMLSILMDKKDLIMLYSDKSH